MGRDFGGSDATFIREELEEPGRRLIVGEQVYKCLHRSRITRSGYSPRALQRNQDSVLLFHCEAPLISSFTLAIVSSVMPAAANASVRFSSSAAGEKCCSLMGEYDRITASYNL